MEKLPQIENSSIDRRDFLQLKSLLILWIYFLQSFGINLLADSSVKKIDYSLLDKLLELPFSDEVMKELTLRVALQKKYNTDANGNLHSLNRFTKEIINFIISQKDFNDFKLLNSIKDDQIDYTYMLNSTAKHNQIDSMKYIQQKLISNKKKDQSLDNALEYAIKSQSLDTTLHLIQQKIKLNDNTKKQLLNILHYEEYENFYKKISGSNHMMLPNYNKEKTFKKRSMAKKTFINFVHYTFDNTSIYEYLNVIIYNSLADLYSKYYIDEFDTNFNKNRIYVTTYSSNYPIDFMNQFEQALFHNGFDSWESDCDMRISDYFTDKDEHYERFRNQINSFIYDNQIDIYDYIHIDMM